MPFSVTWHTLLDECENLAEDATLLTPLSQSRFRITDVQEHRIVVEFLDRDVDETRPLQRDQFETLYGRISDSVDGFDLSRLPPDADPYPAVLSLHPRFEIVLNSLIELRDDSLADEDRDEIVETIAEAYETFTDRTLR